MRALKYIQAMMIQNLDILKLGGYGIISVTANSVPERLAALCETFFKGDLQKCRTYSKAM